MQTQEVYSSGCKILGCPNPLTSRLLCGSHYAQRNKTVLKPAEFVAWFDSQAGVCPYCLEPLGSRFEVDHFHGPCASSHVGSKRSCRQCLRGMIHDTCNEELKWIDRALASGRLDELAPHVSAYLTGRPCLASAA